MPTDYQCEACNLAIQIGWFHYHNSSDGYWAATLGFCQKCGTIHMLEHANDDALPERMFAQPGPIPIAESEWKAVTYRIPLKEWTALGASRACGHCGAQDAVLFAKINTDPDVKQCPRCCSPRLKKLNSWMT